MYADFHNLTAAAMALPVPKCAGTTLLRTGEAVPSHIEAAKRDNLLMVGLPGTGSGRRTPTHGPAPSRLLAPARPSAAPRPEYASALECRKRQLSLTLAT